MLLRWIQKKVLTFKQLDAQAEVTQRYNDWHGNQVSVTHAPRQTYAYTDDAPDRRTHVVFTDGTVIISTYNWPGWRIAETDKNTNTTRRACYAVKRRCSSEQFALPGHEFGHVCMPALRKSNQHLLACN